MMPKRPDRGNEGDLGMVVGYESDRAVDNYEVKMMVEVMSLVLSAYHQYDIAHTVQSNYNSYSTPRLIATATVA